MASGGEEPLIWSLANPFAALPADLTLAPNFGAISGIPRQAGVFRFGIRVGDAQGTNAFKNFELTVSENRLLASVAHHYERGCPAARCRRAEEPLILPDGLRGDGGGVGDPPYSWSIVGGLLPPGVNLVDRSPDRRRQRRTHLGGLVPLGGRGDRQRRGFDRQRVSDSNQRRPRRSPATPSTAKPAVVLIRRGCTTEDAAATRHERGRRKLGLSG